MIPALVALTFQRLGLGDAAARMRFDYLYGIKHRIRKGFCDSEGTYISDDIHKLFGTGQGSGGSPPLWHALSDVMFNCIDNYLEGIKLKNPNRTIENERNEDEFLDDTSLIADARNGDVVDTLTHNSQVHGRYLYATGGKLSMHKRFWCLVAFQLEGGNAKLLSYDSKLAKIEDRAYMRVQICQSQNGKNGIIKRIGPNEAYRTLGAYISADGHF